MGALLVGGVFSGAGASAVSHAEEDPAVRYQGYSADDRAKPYARFMAARTAPAPASVLTTYDGPPVPPNTIPDFSALSHDLAAHGYSPVETGYGQTASGMVWAAVHTDMPNVSAAMWDWWFGWHSAESARYKLWHPDAHLYAGISVDKTGHAVPDRAKYVGNISYVDEYVGPKLQQLAIAFLDPQDHGFDVPAGHTVIFGRVGSSVAPVDVGWLAHQVRPVPGGCEMRSRFYLNHYGLHSPDLVRAAQAISRGAAVDAADLVLGTDLARDLLLHCGQEMHHLAQFLPDLYREFANP
ncbi:DAPG hydrolase family protein [Nocardia sp. NPDC058114]|uniref:DAPG hydrolase family protein n=1 Tax=Nocardia sp. NPDC058114 TaxID=3346346 RepID=UPI0036DE4008